jgi:hypothetical protein
MTRRTIALICVWTLPSVVFLTATAIAFTAFRIPPPDRLDAAERTAVMAVVRAGLRDAAAPAPAVHRPLQGPLAVTVWSGGRSLARVVATGDDVAAAAAAAARQLRELPAWQGLAPTDRELARLQIDIVTGTGPLGGHSAWFDAIAVPGIGDMLAINPGVEGVAAEVDGKPVLLLPHELVAARLLAARRPSSIFPNFAMGADVESIAQLLVARAGAPTARPRGLVRLRTDSFVEAIDHATGHATGHAAAPLPLYRGIPPAPRLSAQTLREAALRGGRYLVNHLASNGRYVYEHDLSTGTASDASRIGGAYSMPRHAGTTYFLAELYRITREPWLLEPIQRAFAHLADLLAQGTCGGTLPGGTAFDCVSDRGEAIAALGSTALTVVALAEYQRATGDPHYLPLATKLSAWLLYMQRPDGSFRHLYDIRGRKPDDKTELLYYSGEAALALARMHAITGEARYAEAAGRALDWLVDWYDFFMAGFFYGEEHWTCIAAEAIWPVVKRDKYVEFCHGYGAFLRAQQPALGDHPDEDDYAGAYSVTPFVVPYNTPAGSRTEAMISSYLLGKHHGSPDARVAGQIRAALQYVLAQQIRPDSNYNVVGLGDGAIPGSPIDRNIRIDYVQHVCSAMIRASEWVDRDP